MRVGICLYGQPRNYKEGCKNIMEYINRNKDIEFDIFFHTWVSDKKFEASPWRKINDEELIFEKEILMKDLIELYSPKKHIFENVIDSFDTNFLKESLIYKNTPSKHINNLYNTLSQMYSRNQVRNIFEEYINETNIHYDFVITTRFDCVKKIYFSFDQIDNKKAYVGSAHKLLIPDIFIIAPINMYLKWMEVFHLEKLMNDDLLEERLKKIGVGFELNPEQIITACFYYYFDEKDIIYSPDILHVV